MRKGQINSTVAKFVLYLSEDFHLVFQFIEFKRGGTAVTKPKGRAAENGNDGPNRFATEIFVAKLHYTSNHEIHSASRQTLIIAQ